MNHAVKWRLADYNPLPLNYLKKLQFSFSRRHIEHVHEGKKVISCEICGRTFPQLQNLQKHIDGVHKKLKPFQCDVCGGHFSQTSSLNLHKKNVHGITLPRKYFIKGREPPEIGAENSGLLPTPDF